MQGGSLLAGQPQSQATLNVKSSDSLFMSFHKSG